MKQTYEQQTYQYPKIVYQPEVRTRTVQVCEYKAEEVSREEQYTEYVPQKRVRTEHVTFMRSVPDQQHEQYTVMVPYQEQQQVPVQVCRMVARKVAVQTASACGNCCDGTVR